MLRPPLCLLLVATAGASAAPRALLPLDLTGSAVRARQAAYLGSSLVPVVPSPARPTWEALLGRVPFRSDGRRVVLDLDTLDPETGVALVEAAAATPPAEGLDFAELRAAGERAYLRTRPFPDPVGALRLELGLDRPDGRWFAVTVASLINRGRRRLWARLDQTLGAALAALPQGREGTPPVGAVFLAEELDGGVVTETHVMRRRADQLYDYALYDHEGRRAVASPHFPQRFRAPLTCAGCHQAGARFPPFREFPDPSPGFGDFLPRVELELTPAEVALVRAFPRAARTQERVLGVYPGLAAVALLRAQAERPLRPWELGLVRRMQELGLPTGDPGGVSVRPRQRRRGVGHRLQGVQ